MPSAAAWSFGVQSVMCRRLVCSEMCAGGLDAVGWYVIGCMVGWYAVGWCVGCSHVSFWRVSSLCVVGGVESRGVQSFGVQSLGVQ